MKISAVEMGLIAFAFLLVLGIAIQGFIYPTNNWDSMSYHMPRIIHWIQNESLAHFRTPIYPQLSSAPFAEEMILNVNLLFGNDLFSNVIQLDYFIGCALLVSLIAEEVGLKIKGQVLSVFIVICLPEGILLASSTHNELVLSFFMLMSIYYLIKTATKTKLKHFILLGISIGLATATKHTAYLYLSPFIILWIIYQFYLIISHRRKIIWLQLLVVPIIFLAINWGHYSRNYQLTNSFFGSDEETSKYYVNEEHSFKMMVSNITRNLSMQFGVPKLAPYAYSFTEKVHDFIGVDLNDPTITSHNYTVDPLATHENNGANTFHFILILLSMVWMFIYFKKQNSGLRVLWIAIVLAFFLFCFYLKWQPWAKLHAPFFILYAVVLAHFLVQTFKSKILFGLVIIGFATYAVTILLFNFSRPFITNPPFTSEIKISDDRYQKYFSRFLKYYPDFKKVNELIKTNQFKNIGLMYGKYGIEYQLFTDAYRSQKKPIHINAHHLCESIPVTDKVDCIVSTTNESYIEYEDEIYYNVTEDNDGYIYLFLKK